MWGPFRWKICWVLLILPFWVADSVNETRRNSSQHHPDYTFPETNIASENGWLEDECPFGARPIFRGPPGEPFVSGRVNCTLLSNHRHESGEMNATKIGELIAISSSRCGSSHFHGLLEGGLLTIIWPGWSYHLRTSWDILVGNKQ